MTTVAIRGYERSDLPLPRRVASLGRRFACLRGVSGVDPFDPGLLRRQLDAGLSEAASQAVLLLLRLVGESEAHFDVVTAMELWCPEDRRTLLSVLQSWPFAQTGEGRRG